MRRFCRVSNREIIICHDAAALNQKAADRFNLLANEAAANTGRFTAALSGGSTPKALYSLLAAPEYKESIPWSKVHLFWGDERCVPPDHQDSNYRMAREALLSKITIPTDNVHRMAGEKDPQVAAAEYEEQLKMFFQLTAGALPRFDLILLGIGEDGHTASLFPGNAALEETQRLVVAPYIEKFQTYRITLSLPVINEAAVILFLIAGKSKSAIVKKILEANGEASRLPAARVQPKNGKLIWLMDQEAASDFRF
jgi:6-phosphogluconolactonase